MNETPVFQLPQVRREYSGTVAVDIDSLDVRAGEILCLLGPTGAGKSTLLRLMACLEGPTMGEAFFQGNPLWSEPLPLATRRRITMVFQRPALLTGTVQSNVEYGLRIRDSKESSVGKVDRILERLGLTRFSRQSSRTLSGGQTQLVALARALILEPDVLLVDEPTSNLDPAHVGLVERVIHEGFRQRRTTVVWATHNLFQARRVSHRVALMLSGSLVEVSPTDVFFHSPSDARTRDFVEGKMVY